MILATVAGWLYYQRLKTTPQYSLALLVDAARRDDQKTVNEIVDIDAVVSDFVPQVLKKAADLYGRGVPQAIIDRLAGIAEPIIPAIKDRARGQLAKVIRDRTESFGKVPFFVMVLAADRYLVIETNGDSALVKGRENDRLELKMQRSGDRWRVVGINDDQLATDVARSIGQQIFAAAVEGVTDKAGEMLGVPDLKKLLDQAGEMIP
ncbi:MAG: hypothetical protein KF736_02760 [Acidobacteria bacterium]|nr:hypothetical protein [Acidobacteriota bacterium]MCW5949329.1 hypothetical protein [Pyrinomonadaceae bacterium]